MSPSSAPSAPHVFDEQGMPNDALHGALECPGCGGSLHWTPNAGAQCKQCGGGFPFRDGLWHAIVPDRSWLSVVQDSVSLFMDFTENRDAAEAQTTLSVQAEQESYFDKQARERDEVFFANWEMLKIDRGARILEIGAGDLRVAAELARRGYNITAIEPVPEILGRNHFDRGLSIPKICGSAARVPFRDGTFDVAYAHTALHHIDDIAAVLKQVGRVVRPGGMMLMVNEPYSAEWSNEARIMEAFADSSFDMGNHERLPKFSEYHRALKAGDFYGIHAWSDDKNLRLAHALERLRIPRRLICSGAPVVSGLAMLRRHMLTHGAMTMWGTRGSATIARPTPLHPPDYAFDPKLYTDRRDRGSLVKIWKALIDPGELPARIEVGANDIEALRRGFTRRDSDGEGHPFKWLKAVGSFFLKVEPHAKTFRARVKIPKEIPADATLELIQDETPLGSKRVGDQPANQWIDVHWPLQSPNHPAVSEFRLKASRVFALQGQSVSLMLREVRCE